MAAMRAPVRGKQRFQEPILAAIDPVTILAYLFQSGPQPG